MSDKKTQVFTVSFAHSWLKGYVKKYEVESALRDYFRKYFLAKGALKIRVRKEA